MLRDGQYYRNALRQVRETSQFDNFKPRHNSQQRPLTALRKLADQVVEAEAHILENDHPFAVGNIILLRGKPGLGKTHLAEAFLNSILKRCPKLAKRLCVCKGKHFFTDYCSSERPFGIASIVLIDDIFAGDDMKFENHPCNVEWFGKFITDVYENRQLMIVTSNVPVFTAGGIMDHMHLRDPEGRVKSRLAEIVLNQYDLQGEDFRHVIGRRRMAGTTLRIGPPNAKPVTPEPTPTETSLQLQLGPGLTKKNIRTELPAGLMSHPKLKGLAVFKKFVESMGTDGMAQLLSEESMEVGGFLEDELESEQ